MQFTHYLKSNTLTIEHQKGLETCVKTGTANEQGSCCHRAQTKRSKIQSTGQYSKEIRAGKLEWSKGESQNKEKEISNSPINTNKIETEKDMRGGRREYHRSSSSGGRRRELLGEYYERLEAPLAWKRPPTSSQPSL